MMEIRDPSMRERHIHLVFPRVFYQRCKVCGYEFRKTTMWKWVDNWDWEGDKHWEYACLSCVPDLNKLFRHIRDYKPLEPDGRKAE